MRRRSRRRWTRFATGTDACVAPCPRASRFPPATPPHAQRPNAPPLGRRGVSPLRHPHRHPPQPAPLVVQPAGPQLAPGVSLHVELKLQDASLKAQVVPLHCPTSATRGVSCDFGGLPVDVSPCPSASAWWSAFSSLLVPARPRRASRASTRFTWSQVTYSVTRSARAAGTTSWRGSYSTTSRCCLRSASETCHPPP